MSRALRWLLAADGPRTWLSLITPESGQTALFGSTGVDADGNVFATGALSSSSLSVRAMTVAKFGASGTLLWARTLGSANTDEGYAVVVDSGGNVIVAGRSLTSALVAKYSPTGVLLWAKTFGASGTEQANGVAVDGGDNIIVVGSTSEGGGDFTGFIVKFDSAGTAIWRRNFGGTGSDIFNDVAVDGSDDIIVVGSTSSSPATSFGAIVAKYNSAGVFQWDRLLDGSGSDLLRNVAVSLAGDIFATGQTSSDGEGGADVLLVRYSAAGALQWQRTLGGSGSDFGRSVVLDASGDLIVSGTTTSDGAGGVDALLAKYSPTGTLQWQRTFGGVDDEESGSSAFSKAAVTPDGDIALAGPRDETGGVADLGSFMGVFPGDGSGTGTVAGYTYEASTLVDATATLTDAAITLVSETPVFTESSAGLTDAAVSLTTNLYQI